MDYEVRSGDSLWSISRRLYGDPRKWTIIAEDNRITAVDRLVVGQRLRIRESLVSSQSPRSAPPQTVVLPGGTAQHAPSAIPARAFTFVLADEVNPFAKKVVRKVMVNPAMAAAYSREVGRPIPIVANPERFGLHPMDSNSPITLGRHAMGMKPSAFQSVSESMFGASRMAGTRFWVDVERARAAGATFHTTQEILDDLDRIARKLRKADDLARVERVKGLVRLDAEQLVRGSIPPTAVKGAASMALTRGLQGVQVVGFVMTAVDLERAGAKSIRNGSLKPITAEAIRQAGGWAAAWAGVKLGAATGALLGIETGPGAVITAGAGAIIGGTAGYFGFDWIADHVDAN